ncbi:MAG: class I SAM-dependent methyltransferase [Phycisphaerales bacterium]
MATVKVADEAVSIEELLAPRAPFDDYSFDQLKGLYNYRQTSDWVRLFVRVLIKEVKGLPRPRRVLNIGCGHGIGRSLQLSRAVHRECDEVWGLEPDPSIVPEEGMFYHYQNASMETAKLPDNYFDLAFSFMVIEHVETPEEFMRKVSACLRPGGVHIFVTVNARHYFTACARFFKSTGLEDAALRVLRGRQTVDEYHYPVQYKCNDRTVVDRIAMDAGFDRPEYVFVEELGPKPYFPLPIRPIWWLLAQKRAFFRNPDHLLTMICRMRKRG